MAESLNLTALNANLGAYCRENSDKLFADMLLDLDGSLARTGITVLDDIKDEYVLPNLNVGDIIRPGDYTAFTPRAGALEFGSRTLKVQPAKGDLMIYPQEFEKTWLSHNRRGKGTYKDWVDVPFYQYIIEQVMKTVRKEVRLATWRGVYNAGGTTWVATCDGVLKKLTDAVTATQVVEVVTGVVTAANVLNAVEEVARGLGDAYASEPGVVVVSRTLFNWYISIKESDAGRSLSINELSGGTNGAGQAQIYVRGTNLRLVMEPALGASQRIIAMTENNLHAGTDTLSEINQIDFQKFNRGIKMLLDFKWGVEFALINQAHKPIAINDQE
jgi:hypothetical protein